MTEKRLCECGCGGKPTRDARTPESGKISRFIRGHTKRKFPRLKVAMLLGHPIPKGVEVHHHSIVGDDGCFKYTSQLVLCENHKYHCYLHIRQRAFYGVKVWRCNINVNIK